MSLFQEYTIGNFSDDQFDARIDEKHYFRKYFFFVKFLLKGCENTFRNPIS